MELEDNEESLRGKLGRIMADYEIDAEPYVDYDTDDLMGAVYGELLEMGEDPDEVFANYGITEQETN